jgi:hypothetical protein
VEEGRGAAPKIDGIDRFTGQVITAELHLADEGLRKLLLAITLRNRIEITVMALAFAERDMNVYAAHGTRFPVN